MRAGVGVRRSTQLDRWVLEAGHASETELLAHVRAWLPRLCDAPAVVFARLADRGGSAIVHVRQPRATSPTAGIAGLVQLCAHRALRAGLAAAISHADAFDDAAVAVFDGRTNPSHFLWGVLAEQLGRDDLAEAWALEPRAPSTDEWRALIAPPHAGGPRLIVLHELATYFHILGAVRTRALRFADIATTALTNLLAAAEATPRVCLVISDLTDAAVTVVDPTA